MRSLRFNGDITLDDVFHHHKTLVYDSVVQAIEKHGMKKGKDEVEVLSISINGVDHTVNLSRSKFVDGLYNAIKFYEELEEYEKCQHCLTLINQLKKKELASR
jgi:hypothetical protein